LASKPPVFSGRVLDVKTYRKPVANIPKSECTTLLRNVDVNVSLYSIALSHSASNALDALSTTETDVSLSRRPKLAMLRSGSRR